MFLYHLQQNGFKALADLDLVDDVHSSSQVYGHWLIFNGTPITKLLEQTFFIL
jgi:hypothetical protein